MTTITISKAYQRGPRPYFTCHANAARHTAESLTLTLASPVSFRQAQCQASVTGRPASVGALRMKKHD